MTKEGMDTSAVVTTWITLSSALPRWRAATDPRITPRNSARMPAVKPMRAEYLKPPMISSITVLPTQPVERPKSP